MLQKVQRMVSSRNTGDKVLAGLAIYGAWKFYQNVWPMIREKINM